MKPVPIKQRVIESDPGDPYILSLYRDPFGIYVHEESLVDGYTGNVRFPFYAAAYEFYESLVSESEEVG